MKLTLTWTAKNKDYTPPLKGIFDGGVMVEYVLDSDTDIRPLVDWKEHRKIDFPYVSPMKADLREAFASVIGEEIPDDAVIGVTESLDCILLEKDKAKRGKKFTVVWFR